MTNSPLHLWKHIRGLAVASALVFAVALSGSPAHAGPADVLSKADGGLLVAVPGDGDVLLSAKDAEIIRRIMQTDEDEEAETSLMRMMQGGDQARISALAIAAASENADRTALVAAAAIRADEKAGIKAANALRYVRGARKRQILLGAHSSGNRAAYRKVRGAFSEDQPAMAGGGLGGDNPNLGTASDRLRGFDNPLGVNRDMGNGRGKGALHRFR